MQAGLSLVSSKLEWDLIVEMQIDTEFLLFP